MQTDYPHTALTHLRLPGASIGLRGCTRSNLSQGGFTLLELLIVIALIGILATIAGPNFQEMLKRNAVVSQNNELVALINTAKSEAVRRSTEVTISIDRPGENTWIASLLDPENTDKSLRQTSNPKVRLAGATGFTFNSRGYLRADGDSGSESLGTAVNLSLTHVNCTSPGQHRTITILPTGQIAGRSSDDCS